MSAPLPRRNPLPQLIPAQVRRMQESVAERLWRRSEPLPVLCSKEQFEPIDCREAASLPLVPLQPGELFGRGGDQWTTHWMRIDLPPADEGEAGLRYLRWQCQGETTVWSDGQPWAGLDIGHRHCPLPDQGGPLWLECCNWQTGVWISMINSEAIGPHGLRFDGAQLAVRDPTAWHCYCDLDAIVQLMEAALRAEPDLKLVPHMGYCRALETASPRLRKLLEQLQHLCDAWHADNDLAALAEACRGFFERWPAESWQPAAALCGHAHLDLVWLWPESATRKKIMHSFATVFRLMEQYPEFRFTQSMPAIYRAVEEDCPQMMADISALIEEGRWEVLGAFEVEPDVNLPGGEALLRSIVIGQKKIEQLTGAPSQIAWIPDVFGYCQCLPQILTFAGVTCFYTTKMTWSKITKFPYTSFVWRGPDGTEVLAHLGVTDYNGEVLLETMNKAMAEHRQAGVHGELLLPTGYGDGGGGPTELHVERARRFRNLSGAPRTDWTRVDAFFDRLEAIRDTLPVYQGELYLEYHRGTYTTRSELKRVYRQAERGLQMHEAARVATGGDALPGVHWQRLAFAHFHDALPGSSIGVVYEQLTAELEAIGEREVGQAHEAISGSERPDSSGESFAFNPLPFPRVAVVEHEGVPTQVALPAVGAASLATLGREVRHPILEATPQLLRHERLAAHFDPRGQLCQLIVDGRPLELTGPAGWILSPDDPAAFDAWDVDHHTVRLGCRVADSLELKVVEHDSARAVLEGPATPIGEASELGVRYVLEAGSIHLKIEIDVRWQESHKILRYAVPTSYRGRHARFGAPFGAVKRPQLPGVEADEAMWEVPGSRWAAVEHEGGVEGLTLLAESKLGYAARDGVLSMSLLRAPQWPAAEADRGRHNIAYAVGPVRLETTGDDLCTSMAADALFSPPLVYEGNALPGRFQWQQLGSLAASWCGPCEKHPRAYFIRLHETAGRGGVAVLELLHPAAGVDLIDWREQPLESLDLDGQPVRVAYRPWQILTLRVTL